MTLKTKCPFCGFIFAFDTERAAFKAATAEGEARQSLPLCPKCDRYIRVPNPAPPAPAEQSPS